MFNHLILRTGALFAKIKKGSFFRSKTAWICIVGLPLIVFLIIANLLAVANTPPKISISILSPQNNFSIQDDEIMIKGIVQPKNAKIKVNYIGDTGDLLKDLSGYSFSDIDIDSFPDGTFVYKAFLKNEKTKFTFSASKSGVSASTSITINRIFTAEETAAQKKQQQAAEAARLQWERSRAGQLCKKYPNWSKDDCEQVANRKIWIGMDYEMMIESAGRKPDSANASNYGRGNQWQYCYHGDGMICLYDNNNDGKIDSYN